jgi:hypothetical protein
MDQLTINDILYMVKVLKEERGMSMADILKLPVYIGDDDELNGIHCGWECRIIDADDNEDAYFIEMINDRSSNYQLTGNNTALLIT